jgi:ribosome-associated toxin RatA of RatAB toxin-antitoxin module
VGKIEKDNFLTTNVRTVHKNAVMPYSALAMYQLVVDVETYPDFLPWCRDAEVSNATQEGFIARMDIARGPIRKSFTTRTKIQPGQSISMSLVDGPFSHLEGNWHFTPLGDDASKIEFHLEFDFSNRLLRATVGPVFSHIAETMVTAFVKRAEDLYGGPGYDPN